MNRKRREEGERLNISYEIVHGKVLKLYSSYINFSEKMAAVDRCAGENP